MTQRNDIEALLRDAYAARKSGNVAAITKMFADNAHFELAGAPQASPIALRCTDRDAFQTVIAGLVKTFEFLDHEILSMIIEGNRAAVHWRSRMRSGITGEEVVTELVDLVTVENGKITSFLEFCDTALAAKLIGSGAGQREALFA
jgi:ketosteroid isomerase-like protein